ncbi:MAG: 1-deoxy-D-xylulose-5-phosphate reductoisomerase [Prevotellaceae bacterium]|jgi:1-deoxy-D-xylulose-5-phosphate reductoisomerase|nr:1-deoxy-D-xylulose-5-phosphate reductoisomerase [Prevotellaceae bacterium]
MKKRIAILGSTGSIGTQALDVIAQHPDKYEVETLTAHRNVQLLARQAVRFQPNAVVIADSAGYGELKDLLAGQPIKVFAGSEAVNEVVQLPGVDVVISSLVGIAGLAPTIRAVEAKKQVALANKETLVAAGDLIRQLVKKNGAAITPVDSEHSAIFQCLAGECSPIEKIYLTASGGPFLHASADELERATREQALRHPQWSMGAKVTIDSASMMNKGFEVIEARWLFDLKPEQIEVLVHPQSVVHSMVQFADGSVKAQLGTPDMRIPIAYALSYPERVPLNVNRLSFAETPNLTFQKPDTEKFRCLALAYEALKLGGNAACAVNAANEVAVDAFLHDKIGFRDIAEMVEEGLQKNDFIAQPTLEDYLETDRRIRAVTLPRRKKRRTA